MPVTHEEDKKFKAYVEEQAKLLKCLDIEQNERVLHYTSGQALLNIVETGTIYASHISCLNDSTELHYGEKLFREAFFELQAKGVSNEIESQYLGRLIKAASEEQAKPKSFTPSDWFVSCFSAEKDDLSQWRAYSGGENGYAIEFLAGGFFNRGSFVAKVNYNKEDHLRVAENLATTTLRFFREGLESRPVAEHENWEKEFWLQWTKSTTQLAPLVKDPAFHGEKEYRIVHLFQAFELSKLKFSQKQSFMAMHLPLVFPPPYATHSKLLPITEVMVGPSRHKEISRTSVDVLLRKNGYVNIPVSMSAIPFQTT